jgi:hypothetical protein
MAHLMLEHAVLNWPEALLFGADPLSHGREMSA